MPKNTPTGNDFFAGLKAKAGELQKLKEQPASQELKYLPLNSILPNPDQPRQTLNEQADQELAADIRERGVVQPIIVRPMPGQPDKFFLVAGNRRTMAAREIGLEAIPALVKDYSPKEARTVAAIENLQRLDLAPLDEANYFQFLAVEYNLSNRQIAELIHKSPSYVDQRLRLFRVKNTQLLQNKQSADSSTVTPKRVDTKAFIKFQKTLNDTLLSLDNTPLDEKSLSSLIDNMEEIERSISTIRYKLGLVSSTEGSN